MKDSPFVFGSAIPVRVELASRLMAGILLDPYYYTTGVHEAAKTALKMADILIEEHNKTQENNELSEPFGK